MLADRVPADAKAGGELADPVSGLVGGYELIDLGGAQLAGSPMDRFVICVTNRQVWPRLDQPEHVSHRPGRP